MHANNSYKLHKTWNLLPPGIELFCWAVLVGAQRALRSVQCPPCTSPFALGIATHAKYAATRVLGVDTRCRGVDDVERKVTALDLDLPFRQLTFKISPWKWEGRGGRSSWISYMIDLLYFDPHSEYNHGAALQHTPVGNHDFSDHP